MGVGVKSMLKSKSLRPSRQTKASGPEEGVVLVIGVGDVGLVTMPKTLPKFPNGILIKAGVTIVHNDLPPISGREGEGLVQNVVRLRHRIPSRLADRIGCVSRPELLGAVPLYDWSKGGGPLVAVVDVAALPFKLGKRFAGKGELTDGSGEPAVFRLGKVG